MPHVVSSTGPLLPTEVWRMAPGWHTTHPRIAHSPIRLQAAQDNRRPPVPGRNEQRSGGRGQLPKEGGGGGGPPRDFIRLLISFMTSAQVSLTPCLPSSVCYHGDVEQHSSPKFPETTQHCAAFGAKEVALRHSSTKNGNLTPGPHPLRPAASLHTRELRRKGVYILKRERKSKESCPSATQEHYTKFRFQRSQSFMGMQPRTSLRSRPL